jgi:diaminohydroxyphosphoribosylaminopyrimidine deaminase/5-amino-6-(5-phosphoribosylamino)uracil reductase
LEEEAKELNKRFITFHTKKRPYIRLKWAQTTDGFVDRDRSSSTEIGVNWISQPETQVVTHQIRSTEQAVLVGWKTIQNDNPSLTTRAFTGENPFRIVIDPQLKAPKEAAVFTDGNETIVLNILKDEEMSSVRYIKLKDIDPQSILDVLFQLNIQSVLIEGGANTLSRFIESGLWDEALVITGQSVFRNGLKAPAISKTPVKTALFGKDRLDYFRNI